MTVPQPPGNPEPKAPPTNPPPTNPPPEAPQPGAEETIQKYEYSLKLRFKPSADKTSGDEKLISSKLASFITECMTKVSKDLRFRDKQGKELYLTDFPMATTDLPNRILYERAQGNRQIQLLLTTMETDFLWNDFKSAIFPWLKNKHLFMDRNFFGKTDIRVSKLGFLSNLHPIQTHRQTLQHTINKAFTEEYDQLVSTEREEFYTKAPAPEQAPEIRIYVHQPSWKYGTKKVITQALAVECLQRDRAMVTHLLTHLFCGDDVPGRLIPFSLPYDESRKNADLEYVNLLKHQNLYLTNYAGVQIAGLHPDDLDHTYTDNLTLRQKILRKPSIIGLEPTASTSRIGKWIVQTTKTQSADTSTFLDTELLQLIQQIPARPQYFSHYALPKRLRMSWTSPEYLNAATNSAEQTTKAATIDLTRPSAWKRGPPQNIAVEVSSQPSTATANTTKTHLESQIQETSDALTSLRTTVQTLQSQTRQELDELRRSLATSVTTIESVAKEVTGSIATLKKDLHMAITQDIQSSIQEIITTQVQQILTQHLANQYPPMPIHGSPYPPHHPTYYPMPMPVPPSGTSPGPPPTGYHQPPAYTQPPASPNTDQSSQSSQATPPPSHKKPRVQQTPPSPSTSSTASRDHDMSEPARLLKEGDPPDLELHQE